MKPDLNSAKKAARLAGIELPEAEAEALTTDFSRIVEFVSRISELADSPVSDRENRCPLHDDVPENGIDQSPLEGAPDSESGFFRTGGVMEE